MKSNNELTGTKGKRHDRFVSIITAITGTLLFFVLWRLNTQGHYELYIVGNVLALLFAPLMVIFFLFREEPSNFGFGIGESCRVWKISLAMFALVAVGFIPFARLESFQDYYPIFRHFHSFMGGGMFPSGDMTALLYGWVSYGLYMFCWEFYFRGYLLFGLLRSIKWPTVILQAIAFGLLHWYKPPLELMASFVTGIILGLLALRAKSFLPCFVLHWAASVTFDILVMLNGNRS